MGKFVSGLILGAGASTRLGSPKQLLPYRETTLLGWVVGQANKAAALDEVVVVLGRAAEEIREHIDFGAARVVVNPAFGEGCSSSYRSGIEALNSTAGAVVIILGDQPGVGPDTINALATDWRENGGEIVLSNYRGRRGHPMLFARFFFERLVALHGDKAAWKLVDANPHLVRELSIDRPFPRDIDTVEDFESLANVDHKARQ
jgi:molybdenum cofactor cytidylyltransferase